MSKQIFAKQPSGKESFLRQDQNVFDATQKPIKKHHDLDRPKQWVSGKR